MAGVVHTDNPSSESGHPTNAYYWKDTNPDGTSASETEVIAAAASSNPTPAANRISNVPLFPNALYELTVVVEGSTNQNGVLLRVPSTAKARLIVSRGGSYRFRTSPNISPGGGDRAGVDNTVGTAAQLQVSLVRLF